MSYHPMKVGKPTHFRPGNDNVSACGVQHPELSAFDGRDINCLSCRRTTAWKVYVWGKDLGAKRVAWRVTIEDGHCIVFTTTAAKAKWRAVFSWRDAGYGSDSRWPQPLRAERVARYDTCPLIKSHAQAFGEDYVQSCMP